MAPDPKDIRVMVPRVRRAVDGPTATSSASISATLDDDQIKYLAADALSNVILLTEGAFGKALVVTAYDDAYHAAVEFATSEELTTSEQSVVVAEAALDFFFHDFREKKISERIVNEAAEWDYALSANLLKEQLAQLRDTRDKALAAITTVDGGSLESYASFLAVRDYQTSVMIEPWTVEAGSGGTSGDTRPGFGW